MEIHIGVDDVDSPGGFCTTYIGFRLSLELKNLGFEFLDLPYLVRLNPNVPFKTRGNAAVSIHVESPEDRVADVYKLVQRTVSEYSERHGKTSPGIAVLRGAVPDVLRNLYERALSEFVPLSFVLELAERELAGKVILDGVGRRRGLVGALAAIGAYPMEHFTYELLVYRDPRVRGDKPVLEKSVFVEVDRLFRPLLFSTYDYVEKRVLAAPRGTDPVLVGLRAFSVKTLVQVLEKLSGELRRAGAVGYVVYKTNQGTSVHLLRRKTISELRPYDSVTVEGLVAGRPEVLEGGHVKVKLCDAQGCVDVMFYRETGRLNRAARLLAEGDRVEVGGGVLPRKLLTLNAELLRVLELRKLRSEFNPLCPRCGARMKSAGRGKGYKCYKCGYRGKFHGKTVVELPRFLEPGVYLQSERAYRHLTRPYETLGLEPEPFHTRTQGVIVGLLNTQFL